MLLDKTYSLYLTENIILAKKKIIFAQYKFHARSLIFSNLRHISRGLVFQRNTSVFSDDFIEERVWRFVQRIA